MSLLKMFGTGQRAAQGRMPSFDAAEVYAAAGVRAQQQSRVVKALELLSALPADTPDAVKRGIVEASLQAFDISTDAIVEAADAELGALEKFMQEGQASMQQRIADDRAEIDRLQAQIDTIRNRTQSLEGQQLLLDAEIRKEIQKVRPVRDFFAKRGDVRKEAVSRDTRSADKGGQKRLSGPGQLSEPTAKGGVKASGVVSSPGHEASGRVPDAKRVPEASPVPIPTAQVDSNAKSFFGRAEAKPGSTELNKALKQRSEASISRRPTEPKASRAAEPGVTPADAAAKRPDATEVSPLSAEREQQDKLKLKTAEADLAGDADISSAGFDAFAVQDDSALADQMDKLFEDVQAENTEQGEPFKPLVLDSHLIRKTK